MGQAHRQRNRAEYRALSIVMDDADQNWPSSAAVFGASGGIGRALCDALLQRAGLERLHALSRDPSPVDDPRISSHPFDLTDEASIAGACAAMKQDHSPQIAFIATGILSTREAEPEKTYRRVDASGMAHIFAINTIGPALIAKHLLPLMDRKARSAVFFLSARVGSIGDNRLGGWHSYRASKAALNMLVRNFAIEMRRTHDDCCIAALHPGTVDTALSAPFQSNVAPGKLFSPQQSAEALLEVAMSLGPDDSGRAFAWDGAEIEP
jgi:NAD(P)-dependent dehydrogenase (short-subunit alcohol dehydrogenase family)